MGKNIGKTDRIIRLILALFLIILAFLYQSWLIAIAGIFVLYESMAGWCALYALIGRNTCPLQIKHSSDYETRE